MKYVQSQKNILLTNCDKFGIINPYSDKEKIMDSFEPKKLALIRILQILEHYTDSDHPPKTSNFREQSCQCLLPPTKIIQNFI